MKKTLLIAAIALVITAGTVSLVDAQMREKSKINNQTEFTEEMKVERETHQAEMQNIMENGTYEEWKAEMESRPRMTDYITPENFAKFQEAHRLKQADKYEEAQIIIEELGIEGKMGMGRGFNKEFRKGIKDCGCQK